MTNSNMSFKIIFYNFYSPCYLKDNFGQTFECILGKDVEASSHTHTPKPQSLSISQPLFST